MNAISTIAQPMPLQDMQTLAVAIAKSNLFGIKTPEQALVLMAIAQAEGRHPVEAARDYDIINGRPAKKAEAMLRDFILAGGKVAWHALTDELADATFTHPQTGEVRIDWDMKRAKTAFGQKDMYTKFPRQMLRSRVVSEGVRTLWPLATSGMYEPGEAADIPAHNGRTIDAERPTDARQAMNDAIPLKAVAARTPPPERKVAPQVYDAEDAPDPLDETDGRQWLLNLDVALANAQSQDEVVAIGGHASVGHATANAPEHVKRRVSELLAKAFARFAPDGDADLDEVVIEGHEKLAAG
jgi:hypothetical protein